CSGRSRASTGETSSASTDKSSNPRAGGNVSMIATRAYPLLACFCVLLAASSAGAVAQTKAKINETLSKECIGPEAKKALETCPGGPKQFDIKKKRSAAFKRAPPPVEKKDRKDESKPQNPDIEQS